MPWLRLIVDLLLWFLIPAAFLLVYVRHFGVPASAVLPHLHVLIPIYVVLATIRLAVSSAFPRRSVSRALQAAVAALFLMAVLLYYAVVLAGMKAWGRVITWDLIATYAAQAGLFAEALGVQLILLPVALAVFYVVLLLVAWLYIGKSDWTLPLSHSLSGSALARVLVYGTAFVAAEVASFVIQPAAAKGEPLALTFFPEKSEQEMHHAVDALRSKTLDQVEDQARAAYVPAPSAKRRNVIFIVVDTLRPDHMSLYGYARDTTPNLKQLETEGKVRKAQGMYAACSNSTCGTLSLIASKYIHQLSLRPFTLHEALAAHGYRTHLILGGDHTSFYRLKERYGKVDSYFDGSAAKEYTNDDRLVVARAATLPAWDGNPVLLHFHFMSTNVIGRRNEKHLKHLPMANYSLYSGLRDNAVNFYDNGVLQADALIHELMGTLRGKRYLEDALVVIAGNHGEALGERGIYMHGNGVDEEVLRIPLVLIAHGYQPPALATEGLRTSQVDVAPSILAELGMPIPGTWSGVPLQEKRAREFVYFQDRRAAGLLDLRITDATWKYWFNGSTGKEYAYNLSADPDAMQNVIDTVSRARKREWRRKYLEMLPGGTSALAGDEPAPLALK